MIDAAEVALAEAGVGSPRTDAELLAAHAAGTDRGRLAVAAVISSNSTPQGLPTDDAFTAGFWVCAGVGVLAIVASLALPSMRRRH